jgi:uncharacterized SAM-binding protein YcdF (DUF218 family)
MRSRQKGQNIACDSPARAVRPATSVLWRAVRRTAIAGSACFVLWAAGLVWFATPPSAEDATAPSDAIVVLTGGRMRLQNGIELLREGKGRKLFVSGVNQQVDLDDLLRVSGNARNWAACCITLGHDADDTLGNALETAQWVRQQGFRSLRLVTAWYHMPRSLLEFDRAMPQVEIIAHPVFPEDVKQDEWWRWRGTTALLVSEYGKYLGALGRPVLERLQFASTLEPAEGARER